MVDPARQVVLGEEEAQQAAERYAKMEAELQARRQQNALNVLGYIARVWAHYNTIRGASFPRVMS